MTVMGLRRFRWSRTVDGCTQTMHADEATPGVIQVSVELLNEWMAAMGWHEEPPTRDGHPAA